MYTVLIMAKKTADNMQEHYPAFREVLESPNIGICPWIVTGNTIETALPQLNDLVVNTQEWRAVVVMYDEDFDFFKGRNDVNPFDFFGKRKIGDTDGMTLRESHENALIRLTHFLVGAPVPAPEYDARVIWPEIKVDTSSRDLDEHSAGLPYLNYELEGGEEARNALLEEFNDWNSRNAMKGIAPSELLLVTTRDVAFKTDTESIRQAWEVHNEADSSFFWKRNLYPQKSRFLLYDIEKKGKLDEEKDAFVFWTALLTLAVNTIDSNSVQPQRLYRMSIRLDSEKLSDLFQTKINELNLADKKLRRSIENAEDTEIVSDEVPKYLLEVPVSFKSVKTSNAAGQNFPVTLTGGVTSDEGSQWERYTVETYLQTAEMIKNVERELEMSALAFKGNCRYKDSEIQLLTPYAEEDFGYSLHDTYDEVLKAQKQLPKGIVGYREEMKEADRKVKKDIRERMSFFQLMSVMGLAALAFILILLPAFKQDSSQQEIILMGAVGLIAILGIGFLVALIQKRRFKKHVKSFRDYYMKMCVELDGNSKLYKTFIGQIASHIHGSSYMKKLGGKKRNAERAVGIRKSHLGFIDEFRNRLSLWGSALRLSVDYDVEDELVLFGDKEYEIDFSRLYSLSLGEYYKSIPLNETGFPVQTPFNFAEKLQIEREEVYDDIR